MPPTPANKRKEAPAEPLKRAIALASRAIAADEQLQVTYATGAPVLDLSLIHISEPTRPY